MTDLRDRPTGDRTDGRRAEAGRQLGGGLFGWRGHGVVLLAEVVGERWALARAFAHGDRLTDVRRWSFATGPLLAAQVRRLTREACGDAALAAEAFAAALAWAASVEAATSLPDPPRPAAGNEPPAAA